MDSDRLLEYDRLSQRALLQLDHEHTVAFWTISPMEVHGPHLPLGTDVDIAQEALRRTARRWLELHPEDWALMLPPLPLGSDVLPLPGSLQVSGSLLERVVVEVGQGLARAGLRTLVIGNNHGGPRHMLALERATRRLRRLTGMVVVNPFGAFLRAMFERRPEVLARIGLPPDSELGGPRDVHAGAFETSLALAALGEEQVGPTYRDLPPTAIEPASPVARTVMRPLAGALRRSAPLLGPGAEDAARGLDYAAGLLDWIALDQVPSYIGPPAEADAQLGQRGLDAMAHQTVELLERALAGENLDEVSKPLLWNIRALARLPIG